MMIRAAVFRAALFAALWWILAAGRPDSWPLGGIAVALATWASLRLSPSGDHYLHLSRLPGFLAFFLWHSIRGGIQVAGMALRGPAALQPGLVDYRVTLPPGAPRILLVNTLGLMPGTLGVDMDDTTLRLHVLDERLPVVAEAEATAAVIARLFGSTA